MATTQERRIKVRDTYRIILGRNKYSQELRNYCYTQYKDGKYYSDCSSSVSFAYKMAGEGFGILNTVGMWASTKLTDVPVIIENGIIKNPEILCVGDMLLFAGTNPARKNYEYVGHVEMVGEIKDDGTYILYGHGGGNPKKQEMNACCKARYAKKTSKTSLGHTGLIRVKRFICDDSIDNTLETSWNLSYGDRGEDVKELQKSLIELGYSCGAKGVDGIYGNDTRNAVIALQKDKGLSQTGVYDAETYAAIRVALSSYVEVTGNTVYIRSKPGTQNNVLGVAKKGEQFEYLKETSESGWHLIKYNGQSAWISGLYSKLA